MESKTKKVYAERINTVIEFIHQNLAEDLDVKRLARMSCFSLYHFHRIIRVYLGESLGAYISRMRVETGAKLLRYSNESVEEIAYNVGYETPSSFSKAFKKQFKVSPTVYRSDKSIVNITFKKPKVTLKLDGPKIVQRPDTKSIYIRLIGTYGSHDYKSTSIKMVKFMTKHGLFGPSTEQIGISHDDPRVTEGDKCRYDACLSIPHDINPEGEIGIKTIEGGKFAVFLHKGSYFNMQETFDAIFSEWIFENNIELRNSPIMEKYLNNPYNTEEKDLLTEIYLPI